MTPATRQWLTELPPTLKDSYRQGRLKSLSRSIRMILNYGRPIPARTEVWRGRLAKIEAAMTDTKTS